MIKQLHDGIATLLATDAPFVAAVQALNFGTNGTAATPKVMRSFRPFRSLGQENFPAWLLEPGDSQSTEQGVGSCHQVDLTEVLLALVWHQQNADTAYNQRLALEDEVVRLFLRNPRPGDVADTWCDAVGNDRSANHPTHVITFRLLADVRINKV